MSEMSDHDLLLRIDERMTTVLNWQDEHMARCHTKHDEQDKEIQGLKEWKYREAGALAVLVFGLNLMGKWLMGWVGNK